MIRAIVTPFLTVLTKNNNIFPANLKCIRTVIPKIIEIYQVMYCEIYTITKYLTSQFSPEWSQFYHLIRIEQRNNLLPPDYASLNYSSTLLNIIYDKSPPIIRQKERERERRFYLSICIREREELNLPFFPLVAVRLFASLVLPAKVSILNGFNVFKPSIPDFRASTKRNVPRPVSSRMGKSRSRGIRGQFIDYY